MPAKTSWRAEHLEAASPERRGKERQAAKGEVVLFFEDPEPVEIGERLMDLNTTGFGASHEYLALRPGQVVSFHHSFAQEFAQVVWLVKPHSLPTSDPPPQGQGDKLTLGPADSVNV